MKKTVLTLFVIVASMMAAPVTAQDILEDIIELSREGGTTRGNGLKRQMFSMQTIQATPIVEAYASNNVITISVQNYRGSAFVEIIGSKGAKQSFFQVYDMGFEAVSLSGLPAGEYTIRITLGTEVFTGNIKKGKYGR